VRLANERDDAERAASKGEGDYEAAHSLNDQFNRRIHLLRKTFKPELSEEYLASLPAKGEPILSLSTASSVLEEYRKVDLLVSKAEDCFWDVAVEWDRHIQLEIDRMRGK
jgi:hypothetical protein